MLVEGICDGKGKSLWIRGGKKLWAGRWRNMFGEEEDQGERESAED